MKPFFSLLKILLSLFFGANIVWGSESCVGLYNSQDATNLRTSIDLTFEDTADLGGITRAVLLKMRADQSIDTIYQELIVRLKNAAKIHSEQEYSQLISEIGEKTPIENETGDRLSAYFERMKTISRLVSELKSEADQPKFWRSKSGSSFDLKKVEQIDQLFKTVEADRRHFNERRAHLEKMAARYSDRYPVVQNLETSTNRYLVLLVRLREQLIEMGATMGGDVSRKINILHGLLSAPIDGLQMRIQNLRLTLNLLEQRSAQLIQLESVLNYQGNSPVEDFYVAGGFSLAESQTIAESYRNFQNQQRMKATSTMKARWAKLKQLSLKFKKTTIGIGVLGLTSLPIAGLQVHDMKIEDSFSSVPIGVVQKNSSDVSPNIKYVLENSIEPGTLIGAFQQDSVLSNLTKADVIYLVRNMKFLNLGTDYTILHKVFSSATKAKDFSIEEATDLRNAVRGRPSFQKVLPQFITANADRREEVLVLLDKFLRSTSKVPGSEKVSSREIKEGIIALIQAISDSALRDIVLEKKVIEHWEQLDLSDAIHLAHRIESSSRRDRLLVQFPAIK